MSGVAESLKDEYLAGEDLRLEQVTSRGEQIKNSLVAMLLNYGYPLINPLLAKSTGELAELWFRTPGYTKSSWRTFEAFYRFEELRTYGDLGNQLLMASPGVKASRNRKKIALRLLGNQLKSYLGSPALVNAVGGGSGKRELEEIKKTGRRDILYCSSDDDPTAYEAGEKEARKINMRSRSLFFPHRIDFSDYASVRSFFEEINRKFGTDLASFDFSLLLGVTEYCDLDTRSNEELDALLYGLYDHTQSHGMLIMGQTDYHDRARYVEKGLGWKMRLRSEDEIREHVEKTGWKTLYCEKEPMKAITMILAKKD